MAYQIQELDPIKELSPARLRTELGIVFAVTFLLVRFGGWHHGMDPLGDPVYPSYLMSILVAGGVSILFALWRSWYSKHSAARES